MSAYRSHELRLRDFQPIHNTLRWRFDWRRPRQAPVPLVARSTGNGLVVDVQQLGSGDAPLPADLIESLADRIEEELARFHAWRAAA